MWIDGWLRFPKEIAFGRVICQLLRVKFDIFSKWIWRTRVPVSVRFPWEKKADRMGTAAQVLGCNPVSQQAQANVCRSTSCKSFACFIARRRCLVALRRQHLSCRAAASDVSLFTDSSLSGPGLGLSGPGASSKKPKINIADVSIESEVHPAY